MVTLSLLAAAWIATAGAQSPSEMDAQAAGRAFTFRVDTPRVDFRQQEDGFAELNVEGFEERLSEEGAPDVPSRVVLVAIPPGATPRLSVRPNGKRSERAFTPRPVPRILEGLAADTERKRILSVDAATEDRAERRDKRAIHRLYHAADEHYSSDSMFPREIAWLGKTGVLRDQRYVEVHVAPVRFDARRRSVLIDAALDITVHFDGAFESSASGYTNDRYEAVYRSSFVNYSQGRQFRIGENSPATSGVAASRELDRRASRTPSPASTPIPSGPLYRIRIDENGPVRLTHTLITAAAPEFLGHDPADWKLTNRGEQVRLQIHQEPGNDAVFEFGEWVQFYGQVVDDEPETVLTVVTPNPSNNLHEVRDFTDDNVYFLYVDTDPQPAMTEREAAPRGGPVEPTFTALARKEVDDIFFPIADELWFSLPFTTGGGAARSESVPLPGLASGTLPAQFRVRLRGWTDCFNVDPDHETHVSLENFPDTDTLVLPAGNENVGLFDGDQIFVHDFGWTHSGGDPLLTDPVLVSLSAPTGIACPGNFGFPFFNDPLLDSIEVDYQRSFHTDTDLLTFDYPDGDADFEVTGFTSDKVEVFEITDLIGAGSVVDAVRLTAVSVTFDIVDSTYTAAFRMDDAALTTRRFVVAGHDSIPVPPESDVRVDRVSTLKTDTTHADMIVIAHPALIESECSEGNNPCSYDAECVASPTDRCEIITGSSLDLLLSHRSSQGIDSRVARIQDVEDDFNDGLPGPPAIKNFLSWVYNGGWSGDPPAYVMLIGDGTYNYKDAGAPGNLIPTQIVIRASSFLGHYASDNVMTTVAGSDFTPDLLAGRISTRTLAETDGVLDKIREYETTAPAGDWRKSLLFVSDRGHSLTDEDGADEFKALNEIVEPKVAGTPYVTTHLNYWHDYCPQDGNDCDVVSMTSDIKDRINGILGDGVAVAQFAGHGNDILWSDDVMFCTDDTSGFCDPPGPPFGVLEDYTEDLTNDLKLPMLVVHNCLSGAFHDPAAKSLGEQWLKRIPDGENPFGGGSCAVWAPSGLGFVTYGVQLAEIMYNDLFGPHKERQIAVPILDGLVDLCTGGTASVEPCQYYVLLGDPTTVLQLPSIGPAGNLSAIPSTGVDPFVDLSWDASSTSGATYDIWRRDVFSGPAYVNIKAAHGSTTYHDASVDHTKLYYYYVIARDLGFESAWSNFNTDCGAPEENDCVSATATNSVPPSIPTGLVITDAETGGRLDLVWNSNPEPDILSYTVHYGVTDTYGQTKTVLITPHTTLTGLINDQDYFFALQASNTSGLTGAISDPGVAAAPGLVLGVKAPQFIGDLRLAKSGPDAVLNWGAVTEDIYGKPATIADYEVYRGTLPQFDPFLSSPIGTPPGTTLTDPLVLTTAAPNYYYLVRAVDVVGNPGGLSGQLPGGVLDLLVEPSGADDRLTWSPVLIDFDDQPTQVSHYEVYASDTDFTRADIRDADPAVTLVDGNVTGESIVVDPGGPNRYYSVLAVDPRGNRSPL